MMGLMMKNEKDELTVIIKGGGPIGTILATSDAKGMVRGYVQNPDVQVENYPNGKLNVAGAVGTDGYVQVIKDLGLKEPYIGSVSYTHLDVYKRQDLKLGLCTEL